MNAASAQHAALRILLEDVEPMLQQAEAVTAALVQVRAKLDVDLVTLTNLVQRTTDTQASLLEVGRKLATSAARIETSSQNSSGSSCRAREAKRTRGALWAACAASAVLAAALTSSVIWAISRDMVEHARIGQALQIAWPMLDAVTRAKVHEVLGKP